MTRQKTATDPHSEAVGLMMGAAAKVADLGEYTFVIHAGPDRIQVEDVSSDPKLVSMLSGRPARRQRVTDDRLLAVAAAYKEGGIDAVMAQQGVRERQAWRLKAEAERQLGDG